MPKVQAGNLILEVPDSFEHEGEDVEISRSDITPVWSEDATDDDDPIGFEISLELENQGTVVIGVVGDAYGEAQVLDGPVNEPDDYDHPDDRPYDTRFMPPDDFVERVSISLAE
ncbi:hypothetical protein [Gluconacetobacter sp.]|uniref:hypothetical protein n=1 Tax=Gluconacetobacter sp. TaxID=1935994 RepID=UPI0039EA0924